MPARRRPTPESSQTGAIPIITSVALTIATTDWPSASFETLSRLLRDGGDDRRSVDVDRDFRHHGAK
jgi:hypothetical protein